MGISQYTKYFGSFPIHTVKLLTNPRIIKLDREYNIDYLKTLLEKEFSSAILYFHDIIIHNVKFVFFVTGKYWKNKVNSFYFNPNQNSLVELREFDNTEFYFFAYSKSFIKKRQDDLSLSPGKYLPIFTTRNRDSIRYFYRKKGIMIEDGTKYESLGSFLETCFFSKTVSISKIHRLTKGMLGHDIVIYELFDSKNSKMYLKFDLIINGMPDSGSGLSLSSYNTFIRIFLSDTFTSINDYSTKFFKSFEDNPIELNHDLCYFINKAIHKYTDNIYKIESLNCKYFAEMMYEIPTNWINYREVMNNFYVKWE